MTSGNIGIGDYSEIIATKIGDVTDVIPGADTISTVSGVEAGTAAEYRSRLKNSLVKFSGDVDRMVDRVEEFSQNAKAAVASIRASDSDAEERSIAVLNKIDSDLRTDTGSVAEKPSAGTGHRDPAKESTEWKLN